MIKGYYLVYDTLNLDKPDGVEKKIISQRNMFKENGFDMEFRILSKSNGTFWNHPESLGDADFIYFRRGTVANTKFISFFKKLKIKNEKLVVFMEIPTFPYEDEYDKSLRSLIALFIDHIYRRKLHNYIDRLVIVNHQDGDVWGIKVLNIVNGIAVKEVKPRVVRIPDGTIKICCVAKFSPWHGYERLIRGLNEYYQGQPVFKVKLVMVGTGVEIEKYKSLAEELNLEKYIDFRGQLIGEKLDAVYDECDMGCCSLGRYKSGIEMTSELKSRELMAKGLPMICGCKIDVLEDVNYPYVVYFPNDETNIDINIVVNKYNDMLEKNGLKKISDDIRRFAMENIDIKVTYQPIVNEAIELYTERL